MKSEGAKDPVQAILPSKHISNWKDGRSSTFKEHRFLTRHYHLQVEPNPKKIVQ